MENLPIFGFGIGGYRSFSGYPQLLGPFKKINVFIGENNSGKSNILRFIRDVYEPIAARNGRFRRLHSGEIPQGGVSPGIVPIMAQVTDDRLRQMKSGLTDNECNLMRSLLCDSPSNQECVFVISLTTNTIITDIESLYARIAPVDRPRLSQLWTRITGFSQGDIKQHWIPELANWVWGESFRPITVKYVSTLRQIPTDLPPKFHPGIIRVRWFDTLSTGC
jgi:hypothetical protein